MIYTCATCLFIFERRGETSRCPDCGKENVREATAPEVAEYRSNREEVERDGV